MPALNEEVRIADSVRRLLAVPVRRRVFVLRRDAPDAQQGKGGAQLRLPRARRPAEREPLAAAGGEGPPGG